MVPEPVAGYGRMGSRAENLMIGPEHKHGVIATVRDRRIARIALFWFLLTFVTSRVLVFLIMARTIPDLYVRLGETHVHHLNFGIFLLAGVGGYVLFRRPANARVPAALYGVGLALTFDEFGMWLNLGGSYWQRASWDAIAVTGALLGLAAFGPAMSHLRPRRWWSAGIILIVVVLFFGLLARSFRHATNAVMPRLQELESRGPR